MVSNPPPSAVVYRIEDGPMRKTFFLSHVTLAYMPAIRDQTPFCQVLCPDFACYGHSREEGRYPGTIWKTGRENYDGAAGADIKPGLPFPGRVLTVALTIGCEIRNILILRKFSIKKETGKIDKIR